MSSIKNKTYLKARYYNVMFIAAVMPFGGGLVAMGVALLFINWLMEGKFKYKFSNIHYPRLTVYFALLYFVYLAGLIYSSNMEYGLHDLETKLSILICPVVFLISRDIDPKSIRKILLAFVVGCLAAFLTCLLIVFINDGVSDPGNFLYTKLSYFIHAGYFSMYISFAICIVLFFLKAKLYKSNLQMFGWISLIVFFFIAQVMLSSKTGLISSVLIFIIAGGYIIFEKRKIIFGVSIILCAILFVAVAINKIPMLESRMQTMQQVNDIAHVDKASTESSAARLLIWSASFDIIKENYLAGVGTGDVKDVLMIKYKEKEMTGAYEHELNAHNQYLQTFIALGIVGFSVLLVNLMVPLLYSFKGKKYLYVFFLALIIFNFMTESMLETQAGVIFYAFFNSLLLASGNVFVEIKDKFDLSSNF